MKRSVNAATVANLPYSAAVVAGGLCFVAGQFGTDANHQPVGDVKRQTAVAIDHLASVLKCAGSRLDQSCASRSGYAGLPTFDAITALIACGSRAIRPRA
jgi:enamine deaminase RidA (YjgF/YER057c/UK114 family)